jgi:hypothetical protein
MTITIKEFRQGLAFIAAAEDNLRLAAHHLGNSPFMLEVLAETRKALEAGRNVVTAGLEGAIVHDAMEAEIARSSVVGALAERGIGIVNATPEALAKVQISDPAAGITTDSIRKFSKLLDTTDCEHRINHGLDTSDIVIHLYDVVTGKSVIPDSGFDVANKNVVVLHFSCKIEANRYKVVIVG